MAGPGLSARALILGGTLSILVAAYSAFAGLKVGGVYWPIVTTSLISLVALSLLGKTSKNEINIMQTAGSSGGLLAAGIIFTLPAAMMLGSGFSLLEIFLISLVGGILGIAFSYPLRKQLIEREKLPCADGVAAAALIESGDKGGRKAHTLVYSLGLGSCFSIARDWIGAIPSFVNLESLGMGIGRYASLGSSVSLIPLAGGFLIGFRFALAWFLGAAFTNFILFPYLILNGLLGGKAQILSEIARPLGVGIVLGAAVVYFILKALPSLGRMWEDWRQAKFNRLMGAAIILCAGALTIIADVSLPLSLLMIAGAFSMSYVAARSTAEMNVDPMEIFAMLIVLLAKLMGFGALPLIVLAAVVTIAAGMAGDMMQDLKAGQLLGTRLEDQFVAQMVGMIAAAFAIGLVLLSLQAEIGSVDFPAPQAQAVKELVQYGGISEMLKYGLAIGAVMTALLVRFRPGVAIAPVAFGIGMYVPIELSLPLFAGGCIRLYAERGKIAEKARIVAAGAIAGEGLMGVAFALAGFFWAALKFAG